MEDDINIGIRELLADIATGIIDCGNLVLHTLEVVRTAGMEIVQHSDIMFFDQSGCEIGSNESCTACYQYLHACFSVA